MPPSRPAVAPPTLRAFAGATRLAACLLAAPAAQALTLIDNGDGPPDPANVIDASDPAGEDYRVESDLCTDFDPELGCLAPPPLSTRVEIRDGADVHWLEAIGHSAVDVLGGYTLQITARDTTSVLLDLPDGGPDQVGVVFAYDDASLEVESAFLTSIILAGSATLTHRGTIDGIVEVADQSSMVLDGIPFATGFDSGVFLSGSGSLDFLGGWITDNGLQASGDSRIAMSGGIVDVAGVLLSESARMHWSGGEISELSLLDASLITIAGESFQVDGVPVGLGPVGASAGLLTGTLANGDPLSTPFDRALGARLLLVPEPATCLLLGLGLLTLARIRPDPPPAARATLR